MEQNYSPVSQKDDDDDELLLHLSSKTKAHDCAGNFVLAIEFGERICYYSVLSNLLVFSIVVLEITHLDSIMIVLVFTGCSYFFAVMLNWFADAFCGKYNMLLISLIFYFFGISLLLITAHFHESKLTRSYFLVGLLLIAIGSSGVKSNISVFGGLQARESGEGNVQKFFNRFYWLINLSSFLSITFIAYLQIKNFFYGFIPAFSGIFFGLVILLCARSTFYKPPGIGSQLSDVVRIMKEALSRRFKFHKQIREEIPDGTKLDLLEYAHVLFGGHYSTDQIEIVRSTCRVTLMMSLMIIHWTVYFQMPSVFLLQSHYYKLKIYNFDIPAASMCIFDAVVVILFIKLMDVCVYPLCTRINFNFTPLRRMGVGLFCSVIAMAVAGVLEINRKKHVNGDIFNNIKNSTFNSSALIVFWQGPQYVIVGLSEVLTSISGLEFAYSQSPKRLQGIILSLFLAVSGVGAFLACAIVKVVSEYTQWLCEDINKCNLEYYYFLLGGISFLNFLLFVLVAFNYSYVVNYETNSISRPPSTRPPLSPIATDDFIPEETSRIDLSGSVSSISTFDSDIVIIRGKNKV